MKIIQVVPTLSYGDAVGNNNFAIKKLLNKMGYKTDIYASAIVKPLTHKDAKTIDMLPKLNKEDVVIYHFSIGNPLNEVFANLNCRKIMIYHNITPPEFFKNDDPGAAYSCWKGLEEARKIKDRVDYCITVSEFNKSELIKMGYTCPIDVVPILIPFKDYEKEPDLNLIEKIKRENKTNIIFTGRIAPNKKQEDIITSFSVYNRHYNQNSRLTLVGNYAPEDVYASRLHAFVNKNNIKNVKFTGHIKFNKILSYFKTADLFLCMSEHEGFGVPLVEAMYFDIPIIAYNSSAIKETLSGAGLLIENKDPKFVAACMNRVLTDEALRKHILETQRNRLKEISTAVVAKRMKTLLENFINK